MKHPRNLAFIVLAFAFLGSTLGWQAYSTVLGTDQASRTSVLEGRTLQGFPKLTAKTVASGTFQDRFEQFAADSTPLRDLALETNAALQRASIDTASASLGIGVRPTFFGSGYLYEPDVDALVRAPHEQTAKDKRAYRRFAKHVARAAKAHPDKRFVILVVAQSDYSESNEAAGSCPGFASAKSIARIYRRQVGSAKNVTVQYADYATPEEYFQHFFRTDNHWNIYGTANAYNAVAKKLGLGTFLSSNDQELTEVSFSGAWARLGLRPLGETPLVEGNDFSKMTVHERDGSTHDASWRTRLSRVKIDANETADDFYVDFYGAKRTARIDGLGPKKARALLVGDSFAASFQYPLATQYGSVTTSWALHGDFSGKRTFERELEKSDADDVFFVASPASYESLSKRYPNYWR